MTRNPKHIPLLHREVDMVVREIIYACLHNVLAGIEVVIASHLALLPETRTSNPLSKLLRPLLEHKRIRTIFGANLAGALIAVGSVSVPGALEAPSQPAAEVLAQPSVVVTTEQRFQMPVQLIGISQGFSAFHPGVDMRAPLGSPIKAVANGKVLEVVTEQFGYGHHVVVEHEGTLNSLYAHMGTIAVQVGQEVTGETVLGTVGLTGWTTGPHLHLEVYDKGHVINPVGILPIVQ